MADDKGRFGTFIAARALEGELVVQPRMGFGEPELMRRGLVAVRDASATTVGTITLDSFTRVGDHAAARRAVDADEDLNGYPIVAYGPEATRELLNGVAGDAFPVQVRHGSALPEDIFTVVLAAGVDATEGGPISYCLPYSRVPLRRAVSAWETCCRLLAEARDRGVVCHLESFGGCMLGQLCPPALLVALSVLEGIFFTRLGVGSVSLSYAQQTSLEQDVEAVAALRRLANEHLADVDWHVVIYTYMGLFPATLEGAERILQESVELAIRTDSERLIVKTPAEAHRIPTIEENVASLEAAARAARRLSSRLPTRREPLPRGDEIYAQARFLVEMVLDMGADVGRGLITAFEKGYLDVPYCLHPDNANCAGTLIDQSGALRWASLGRIPLPRDLVASTDPAIPLSAGHLLRMLAHNQRRFDVALAPASQAALASKSENAK